MKFGGRKSKPAGELDLSGVTHLGGANEFLRMWSEQGGAVTCFIQPAALGADPAVFGIALMDAVRHGAKAFAAAVGVSEDHALDRILEGFDAERAHPTDQPTQLGPGKAH